MVGVLVGVGVFVLVGVTVGVFVLVGVAVGVGVLVAVTVGVGVGVAHKHNGSAVAVPLPCTTVTLNAQDKFTCISLTTVSISVDKLQY